MLKSRNNFIRNYLSVSLTEQHMATLASIIKDVDKDVKGECFFYLYIWIVKLLVIHLNSKMCNAEIRGFICLCLSPAFL